MDADRNVPRRLLSGLRLGREERATVKLRTVLPQNAMAEPSALRKMEAPGLPPAKRAAIRPPLQCPPSL